MVDKPSGILVHKSTESSDRTFLLQIVRNRVGQHVFPVHRLDRAVSGVIVFALSSEIARELQARLQKESSIKEYVALVRGTAPASGLIDHPLTDERGIKQTACTSFEKIGDFEQCSLLKVLIATGRRHQIRRHLSHIKHQILGDTQYGKGRINHFFRDHFGLSRIFLHARSLTFEHPTTSELMSVTSPIPDELEAVLKRLLIT